MNEQEMSALKEWSAFLKNTSDFTQAAKVDGIKFVVRTSENSGHHRPYLHVETAAASLSIAIDNGDVLAASGKINLTHIKQAQNWMKNKKQLIQEKWDEFSNGIQIAV